MSKEVVDLLSNYGTAVVLIIAAGTIVAAVISALNALTIAWLNTRSSRQLAIDAAHREYRKDFCTPFLADVRAVDLVAANITESVGYSMDAGIPMSMDHANAITAFADAQFRTMSRPTFRVAPPRDATLNRAFREFVKAEALLRQALEELTMALREDQAPDLAHHRRGLVIAADRVTRATMWVDVAAEAFIFDLPAARRRVAHEMKRKGLVRDAG